MPSRIITANITSNSNADLANGSSAGFATITSDTGVVSNATVSSASVYISSHKTYSSTFYLNLLFNGTGGAVLARTNNMASNSTVHASTEALINLDNALLTTACSSIYLKVVATSGTGNKINFRAGCTVTLTIDYTLNYTACGEPTAVSVNSTNVAPGAAVTLSWSGASAGISNGITGYQIYRSTSVGGSYDYLTSISTSGTSGSVAVTAPTGNGASYYYKVLTVGSVGGYSSGLSGAYAALTCSYSAVSAPSTVAIDGAATAYVLSGSNVTLSWSGAAAGTNNPITGYHVYRDGVYYAATTGTSMSVPAHLSAGSAYTYTVYTLGAYANSGASIGRVVYTYSAPSAPTAVSVSDANPDASTNVTLSWSGASAGSYNGITGYQIYRSTSAGSGYALLTSVSTSAGSGSVAVTSHATMGSSYYYKVVTIGERSSSGQSSATATVTSKVYTACTAPTAVTVSAALANIGASITLSWSGASAGTNNPIASYTVYRSTSVDGAYEALSTLAGTSLSVSAHAAQSSSYFYKVAANGTKAGYSSGLSAAYAALKTNSSPTAPTSFSASPTVYESGDITLAWSGAADTDGNISKYFVQYATSADGSAWSAWQDSSANNSIGTQSAVNMTSLARGSYARFQVAAVDALGLVSAYILSNTIRRNSVPAAPIITVPAANSVTYQAQPRILITVGDDADGHSQALTLAGYTASSTGNLPPGKKVVLRRSAAFTESGTQNLSITSTDTLGAASSAATRVFSYQAVAFIDPSLISGTTPVKADHMNELRSCVNNLRVYYGLIPIAWAEAITSGSTSLAGWTSHVLELRSAIEDIVSLVNGWDTASITHNITLPAWIDISTNTPTAAVMEQLRSAISLL